MTREHITVGVLLRVIAPRWDQPAGTLARVTETGYHFLGGQWWFTVEWLTRKGKRSRHSLRMAEEDLKTFEIVTETMRLSPGGRESRFPSVPCLSQLPLPFTTDEYDE